MHQPASAFATTRMLRSVSLVGACILYSCISCCSAGSAISSAISNCSASQLCPEACSAQTDCRSWWPSSPRRDWLLTRWRRENVSCLPDACSCEAAFYIRDAQLMQGRQVFCLEGELAVCSGSAYNLTCPAGTRLKIWYAYYGRRSSGACSVMAASPNSGNASTETLQDDPPRTTASSIAESLPQMPTRQRTDQRPTESCLTPVLTSAIRQCDGRPACWLQPDELLADVAECRSVPEPYLLIDFACLGSSDSSASAEQELFFRWGLLLIGALFPATLLALLVTVQLRKKRQDAYKMNSMHLPLTRHENPDV